VTDDDARAVYASWIKDLAGANALLDLRILVLKLADAEPGTRRAAETLAGQIVAKARAGADFCALADVRRG